jgi:hypothetical protein
VERETARGWSVVAEIETVSTARAVAHAAKAEGTYRVHVAEGTETQYYWVPAEGEPQPLKRKRSRSG